MLPFTQYAKIKDRYCICYFGYSDEYLVLLRLVKPLLEKQFPGLQICLGCKDEKVPLLGDSQPILKLSQIKMERGNFAYVRELGFNGTSHPVENLLSEAGISKAAICSQITSRATDLCVLITEGSYPTKNMEQRQIAEVVRSVKQQGYEVQMNTSVEDAGLVVGVESVGLFEAAARGVHTILIPTGYGLRLYKMLFPSGEVKSR